MTARDAKTSDLCIEESVNIDIRPNKLITELTVVDDRCQLILLDVFQIVVCIFLQSVLFEYSASRELWIDVSCILVLVFVQDTKCSYLGVNDFC